jgi:hypothetical protein
MEMRRWGTSLMVRVGGILLVDVYGFGDLHGGIDRVADFELGQLG